MQWWLTSSAAIRITHCDGNTHGKKKSFQKKIVKSTTKAMPSAAHQKHALHQQQAGQIGQNMKRKQKKDAPPLRQTPRHNHVQHNMARYRPSKSSARRPQQKLTESNKHTTQSASRKQMHELVYTAKSKLEEGTHATRTQNNPARTPITRNDKSKTTRSTIAHASRNQGAAWPTTNGDSGDALWRQQHRNIRVKKLLNALSMSSSALDFSNLILCPVNCEVGLVHQLEQSPCIM